MGAAPATFCVSPVLCLRLFGTVLLSVLWEVTMPAMRAAEPSPGFVDYGVAAPVAECRSVMAMRDANGRNLVIATTRDMSAVGYILVTDIDRGETQQYFYPEGAGNGDIFASLASANGRLYTGAGNILLEFDPTAQQWLFHGVTQKQANYFVGCAFTDGPDGLIYGGTCPNSHLVSYNPQTHEIKDYGQLDPQEQYFNFLAFDSAGWAYAGLGTARWNIVAFNVKTNERRQILDETERKVGSARVYASTDGKVYGQAGTQYYRLFEGRGEKIAAGDAGPAAPSGATGYGQRSPKLPDGRQVVAYNLDERWLEVGSPGNDERRRIPFDYKAGGVEVTSLAEGPDAAVYASTAHPMHLARVDIGKQAMTDLGPIPKVGGGNFCAMTRQGNFLIGGEYSHGTLWAYDVTKPWHPGKSILKVSGVPARELASRGQATAGHFSYLETLDLAFFRGDAFGAEGHFPVQAPADGSYYVHILPFLAERYCTVQFLLDGAAVGEPFSAASRQQKIGPLQVFGPVDLKAGEHRIGVRVLETQGQEPWCAIMTLDLSTTKRDTLVEADEPANPYELATWHEDICRPRTALAYPDGKHVMMAGFAGYGRCGGGLGIVDLETGQPTLLTAEKDLLPGHSTITLALLPDGNLIGGTSADAPGGGHTTATEGEIWILDWASKKVAFRMVPVPGDRNIVSVATGPDGLVYGLSSNSTFFVFDPVQKKLVHSASLKEYGGVPRHALHRAPDGTMLALFSNAIVRLTPGTFAHEKLAATSAPISAGGALASGRLYFASGSHLWSWAVAQAK